MAHGAGHKRHSWCNLLHRNVLTSHHQQSTKQAPNTGPQEYAISINGGVEPVWSPDGSELFYRSGDQVMVVAVDTTGAFRASAPTLLFAGNYDLDNSAGGVGGVPNYDVVPDGRLVMVKPDRPNDERRARVQIQVVLNWFEELNARVPVP